MKPLCFGPLGQLAVLAASAALWAGTVQAQTASSDSTSLFRETGEPVAIVEDAAGPDLEVAFMDYLRLGRTLLLGSEGRLVLGYLKSCVREEITGGVVVIGLNSSTVTGGEVERSEVECDGGVTLLTAEEAAKSGVIVFRGDKDGDDGDVVRVYDTMPLFTFSHPTQAAVIERLDRSEPVRPLLVTDEWLDLADQGIELVPGARYEIRTGKESRKFTIDPFALESGGPLVGRLVPM